jgi:hypothetical protein
LPTFVNIFLCLKRTNKVGNPYNNFKRTVSKNILFCRINIHTLKVAFKITPVNTNFSENYLLVEASDSEISLLIYTKNPMALQGFYKFELDKNPAAIDYAEAIKKILATETVLQQTFAATNIFYNFSAATLVPAKYFVEAEKENMLELLFGKDVSACCFQENVLANDIKIVYRVPATIYETFNSVFPKNSFKHATTNQISNEKYTVETLECILYSHCIKVLLFKEGKIQIVQFFEYETPIDVSYHLLNVCERFNVSPNEVKLILSGMIEEKSNLYDDVYKYFLNISFANLPADAVIAAEMKAMPNHFYTNLTALALCV